MGNVLRGPAFLLSVAVVMTACSSSNECETDADEDGYCASEDCNDSDPRHYSDCRTCSDPDGDGYGVGCDLGLDCNPTDGLHWADCETCTDSDRDGRGAECDLGEDCADDDADSWENCGACTDSDGDDHFVGCDAFVTRAGPDCDDADAENWLSCDTCSDEDGDGYPARCDAYAAESGPDCNDEDPDNWASCLTCIDADADSYYRLCDAYTTRPGPDCNDGNALHWNDCGSCTDLDLDGRGTGGCDLGSDCNDTDRDNWTSCASCLDTDGDGYSVGCDAYFFTQGPDCDDSDGDNWTSCGSCLDTDSDGYYAGCDAYTTTLGPDCNDGDPNNHSLCFVCTDNDNDGYYANCDAYTTIDGPDCSDADLNNWDSCATCTDADGDGRYNGCDDYVTINGPDCAEADPAHWSDCGMCVDNDGDGYGASCDLGADCDDTSANHWSDCDTCVDGDGDGYGAGCNLGDDCADDDPDRNPGIADPTVDGVDQDCNGVDGPGLFDDFDDGVLAPVWSNSGDSNLTTAYASSGSYSLNVGGGGGTVTSAPFDTTACTAIFWRYQGKRGPEAPDSSDFLWLEYWDGSAWQEADQWAGGGFTDTGFSTREGLVSDPAALRADLMVRFQSSGSGFGFDDYYLDDVTVGCAQSQAYAASPALSVTDGGGESFACGAAGAVSSTIAVADSGTILDVNVGATLTHPLGSDLDIFLEFDNGGTPICVELSTDNGTGADYSGTTFDDDAATLISAAASPFSGTFQPEGLLSAFDGVSMTGTWTLWVSDDTATNQGTLDSWQLTVTHR